MGVTAFSFLLLPLSLIWFWSPAKLLKLMLIAAVFEAAAALTLGSLGVQPGLVPGFAFIGYMSLQFLLGAELPGCADVTRVVGPFVAVTVWAIVSSVVIPRLLQGQVLVWPQKPTPPYVLTPLAPSSGNINQDLYLKIDCLLMVLAAIYIRSRPSSVQFIRFYLWSGVLVGALAVWQFLHRMAGVPFPDDMLYSNPGLAILNTQTMGVLPRVNGPFTEPSALATFMVAMVSASAWAIIKGHRDAMLRWMLGIGLLTIGLTTSATGIAVVCALAVGVPALALATGALRMMSSVIKLWLPAAIIAVLLFVVAAIFIPNLGKIVNLVFNETANKQDSSSYKDRSQVDYDSINVIFQTYGLGAGWGSNRSSSLLPGLLASVGIPGCAGLLWFGFVVTQQVKKARRLRCSRDDLLVVDVCCGALVGYLLAAFLSNPMINSATFFFLLALLIGCTTRITSQAVQRRAHMMAE
jgi:hypothetical protein